jgi:hypothetical protein
MLLMYEQCYHVMRMQLRRPESTQSDFQKDTILGHVSYYQRPAKNGQTLANNSHHNTLSVGALY